MYARSVAAAEEPAPLTLSIAGYLPVQGRQQPQSASATKETSLSGFRTKSMTKQPIISF